MIKSKKRNKMNSGFIRCLFGKYDNTNRITSRRSKIDNDIKRILNGKFKIPFVTYVFGEDNYKMLVDKGITAKLVDKNPTPFDITQNCYLHKLHLIKAAFSDYKELVYLDWDVYMQKELPDNFWEECRKKEFIQGCLQVYRRPRINWRKIDSNVLINGGFLYIGWHDIINQAIEVYNEKFSSQPNDEVALTYLIDRINNGWSRDVFKDRHETPFCRLHKNSAFSDKKEDATFLHIFGRSK